MICWGANRVVLLIGRLAIKLPRPSAGRYGFANNRNEARWAREHESYCPVLWCAPFGVVLIMRRCEPLTDAEFNALNAKLPALPGVERKASSWGVHGGKIYAIDYGWR